MVGRSVEELPNCHQSSSRSLGSCSDASNSGHIRVAVRVRPLPAGEEGIIEVAKSGAIAIRKDAATGGNEFLRSQQGRVEERAFDNVFGPQSTQQEVYLWGCAPLLSEAVSKGKSATVFVYGATGAGKTHTMFGGSESSQQGIIVRAIPEVFRLMGEYRENKTEADGKLEVKISFLEIYNEVVRDLLQEGGSSGQCRVLEDDRRGVVKVANLVEANVQTAEEALWYLRAGMQARTVEATAANAQSSRAHAVFSLTLEHVKLTSPGPGPFAARKEARQLHSKISLIDLAGSERASFTQNTGSALKDGARINQSLLALANCIDALTAHRHNNASTPRKKPPYRDSKLTLMLKSSLTGEGMVSMIANVHPGRSHFEDSNNTLEYAKRASTVRSATGRRLSRAATLPCAAQAEESNVLEESCTLGTSSSSTLPHRATPGRKSLPETRPSRSQPSSGESAPETTCPEECLSEISLGSAGADSLEDVSTGGLAASAVQLQKEGQVSVTLPIASQDAEECAGALGSSDATPSSRSEDSCEVQEMECQSPTAEEADSPSPELTAALRLIEELRIEKAQMERRLKSVIFERDRLFEDRRDLEKENEQLRAASEEKNEQIAMLLSRSGEQICV